MNVADAERMAGQLAQIGYARTEDMHEADLILFNTCCVRESAEMRIYGKIGEVKALKRANPHLLFGIAGCMAQKEGQKLIDRAPHIDFVLGTGHIQDLHSVVTELLQEQGQHVVLTTEDNAAQNSRGQEDFIQREGTVSAWVPIMYGCNNFCSYCIVPYVRGRERSRRPVEIVREVEEAVSQGFREVTLLGQNVNSYGKGLPAEDALSFAELLHLVDKVPGIQRVRYMTSHPKDLSDEAIAVIQKSQHICEHFHLPVQHGSDHMLKAMRRIYDKKAYRTLVHKIRESIPHASLTTDLIVGFPGETETDFHELLDFLREMRYDAAYTFLYSPRSGTPAATMTDQVPDAVKHERLQKLMDVQNAISLEKNQALRGQTLEVLVEGASRANKDVWTGRTRTNKVVLWQKGNQERVGDLVHVRITHPQTWVLKGELMAS